MLESAEIGHRVPKQTYAREERKLRAALLNAQYDLSQSGRGPVLLIISGVEAGGRGETANKLTEWMDPRHIRVVAFAESSPEESAHPEAWRYWHALPPRGKLGIFLNAWYHESVDHLRGNRQLSGDEGLHARLEAIREHEQMLTDEGRAEETARDARPRSAHELARHPRRLGRLSPLQQAARSVGAPVAGNLDRLRALVRGRRCRRALSLS